ncbi:MAG: hypothetical protein RIT26_559 [Pseudomonadota bacterium]|jgi:hypothetical protein
MKKTRFGAVNALIFALMRVAGPANADSVYVGTGYPTLFNFGYAKPVQPGLNWRVEYATGLSIREDRTPSDDFNGPYAIKAHRLSLLADWYPFDGKFRLVGGVNYNDIKSSLNASGRSTFYVNSNLVDLTDKTLEMQIKYQPLTPYMGLGWGSHQKTENPGLGFYSELGLSLGHFNVDVNAPGLVGSTHNGYTLTQTDIDADAQKARDTANKLKLLPNLSLGLVYRW